MDDYDITHVNPIFKVNSRTMIASSGKDGVLRVVDGDTHKIVYSVPFTTQLNSEVPLTTTPIKVCPGILGGDEWNSAAYSPKLSLLVVPSDDLCCSMNQKDKDPPSIEKANTGEKSYFGGPITHGAFTEGRGRLTGFDAATGKERWRYESPTLLVAGVAVTASNLVFTGEVGGFFDARRRPIGQGSAPLRFGRQRSGRRHYLFSAQRSVRRRHFGRRRRPPKRNDPGNRWGKPDRNGVWASQKIEMFMQRFFSQVEFLQVAPNLEVPRKNC